MTGCSLSPRRTIRVNLCAGEECGMERSTLDRRLMIVGGLSLAATPAAAQGTSLTGPGAAANTGRPRPGVVEVWLNDRGPYNFAIDTAASASVVASDLVGPLELRPGGETDMHTVVGLERVSLVRAGALRSGALAQVNARLAVGERRGLLGLDGLIGLDLLTDHRIVMRFRGRQRANITRSRLDNDSFLGAIRPRVQVAPLRTGSPIRLMTAGVTVRGQQATAIIDSGAQVSLINPALARASSARPLVLRSAETADRIQSPTGRAAPAEPMVIDALHFDAVVLDRLAVLMGDFHIFRHLGFSEAPAMLLGMDVLSLFEQVAIDLRRGEIVMEV